MIAGAQRCARAVIEYEGTAFAGSQYQPNLRTVQGELEEALNRLTGERVRIRLAGRTDAGVHATGQVVAFCVAQRGRGENVDWRELRERMNGLLPADLAVRSLRSASRGFDPRRQATARVYRYRIRTGGARRPLDRHRTFEIDEQLDVAAMRAAARELVGERDFAALGSDARGSTRRRLSGIMIVRRGDLIEIRVTGNAFLRRMVRSIVAILIEAGRGKLVAAEIPPLLGAGERALAGRAAPARGLTLERVIYRKTERTAETPEGCIGHNEERTGEQAT